MKSMGLMIGIILVSGTAAAFGYVEHDNRATVLPGDATAFRVSLFGTEESVTVTRVKHPADWDVTVDPDHVMLPPTKEYRFIETGDGYRRIVPITVTAPVPIGTEPGEYGITLILTGTQDRRVAGSGLAVRQRQEITFTVIVPGNDAVTGTAINDSTASEDTGEQVQNGVIITGSKTGTNTEAPQGAVTEKQDGNTWILLLLFEFTWGIVIIYVLKRKEYL